MARKLLFSSILLIGVIFTGYTVDLAGIEGSAGLIWIGNMEAEGGASAIKPIVGASAHLDFDGFFGMEPMVAVTGLLYEFVEADSKPVPATVEAADSAYFLATMFDPGASFTFPVGKSTTISAVTSAAIFLRIPLIGYGEENARDARAADTETNRAAMAWYMYSGRFIYPRLGLRVARELPFSGSLRGAKLTGSLDSYWPWINLFSGENPERGPLFLDQMMIRLAVGIRVSRTYTAK